MYVVINEYPLCQISWAKEQPSSRQSAQKMEKYCNKKCVYTNVVHYSKKNISKNCCFYPAFVKQKLRQYNIQISYFFEFLEHCVSSFKLGMTYSSNIRSSIVLNSSTVSEGSLFLAVKIASCSSCSSRESR